MTGPTHDQRLAWMAQWRSAAIALQRARLDEVRGADLGRIARDLEDACMAAAGERAASRTSGLIEQQRALHRADVV